MTAVEHTQADIIDLLLDDHRAVAHLFDSFDQDLGIERREGLFRQLTTMLVQHEVAEEVTVYTLLRELGDAGEAGEAGEAQADTRIEEQSEADALLRSMERLDVMSDAFLHSFAELRTAVLRHAYAEENEVFPYPRGATSPEDRATLAHEYERARRGAPTHPRPHAPDTPPGNLVVGPVTAVADRVRDALRSPGDAR